MSLLSKKFFLGMLACTLLTTLSLRASEEGNETWQRFTSEENCFSIDLPQKPEHIHQTITIPQTELQIDYDTYISEPSDKIVYVISVWNYPEEIDMSKPEVNLQDGFGGMLSALPNSEVEEMNMSEIEGGHKSLEFLVKNEDIYFHGKLILVQNTLYQVFSVYKTSEDMKNSYSHFIDSFRLVEEGKCKANDEEQEAQKMKI